jgi:hypothetical protein
MRTLVVQEDCTFETFYQYDYTEQICKFEGPKNSSQMEFFNALDRYRMEKYIISKDSNLERREKYRCTGTIPTEFYSASCKCMPKKETKCKAEEKLETLQVTLSVIFFSII